jgi:hypothetical protein
MATKSTPPKKTLAQRLLIKTGMRVALLNAPQDYTLGELPAEAQVQNSVGPAGTCDVVQLFAATVAELNAHFAAAKDALKQGGVLWICYPKKKGKIKTDISRDAGWQVVNAADWLGVTQISLDDTWSALRFRPRAEIKTLTRKFE